MGLPVAITFANCAIPARKILTHRSHCLAVVSYILLQELSLLAPKKEKKQYEV